MSAALTDIGAVEHARRIVEAHDACVGAARDGAHSPGVALRRPRNDEAPGVQAEGPWVQREVDSLDCARRQSANQHTIQGEHERLLERAQGLATRLAFLGMASDLATLPLDDLRGAYRFLRHVAEGA